jgi:hypothetical protein
MCVDLLIDVRSLFSTLLERDYAADDDADEPMPSPDGSPAPAKAESKLDKRVQNLVKLICDLKMMKDAMLEVGYDANKLPLGKLSKEHIKKGYQALQDLADVIKAGQKHRCVELSNTFYTLIRQSKFHHRRDCKKTSRRCDTIICSWCVLCFASLQRM